MPGGSGPAPAGPPELDPRVERSQRVILAAALDLLAEVGCGGITMEAVAARAGVGRSTVYRHWPDKLALVEDAIRTLKPVIPAPAAGTVRQRVTTLLQVVAAGLADSTWASCLPAIIDAAERDPEVLAIHRRLAHERRQILVDLLDEGVQRGEISPAVDLGIVADCLIGPLVVRRLLLHEAFDPAEVPALVDQVLPPQRFSASDGAEITPPATENG
ncbi:MAG TPA: TetR/AcrR family transcriptional regulator [Acidimicrobiales bacterium]